MRTLAERLGEEFLRVVSQQSPHAPDLKASNVQEFIS